MSLNDARSLAEKMLVDDDDLNLRPDEKEAVKALIAASLIAERLIAMVD